MNDISTTEPARRNTGAGPFDETDLKILRELQQDCSRPVAEVAVAVGLSATPCWRRIQKMQDAGTIKRRVALIDRESINLGVTVFVSITTDRHSQDWFDKFHATIGEFPEVMDFYRMSGPVDYLLRVVVPSINAYDAFYKRLISRIEISDVSSTIALEEIKSTTELPLNFLS